ncbi:hypothetical protein LRS74_19265 [Streptomyces sp. LX-29]|uniref:hypothetical protein n=1 Tax=Streptomyces sp. LX-29 TaxID=2900152 RepID=UPI00240D36DF|nr:hypothetical protein [Streptomyces sp. LX-29]WFB08939.1 hypothetical protein LRS74_19265 [Streptomyces sp. LX-29]
MSVAFTVSAAVRPSRTVAARRALLTVLLLGGFLALAFILGGSAQAAERGEGTEVPVGAGRPSVSPAPDTRASGVDHEVDATETRDGAGDAAAVRRPRSLSPVKVVEATHRRTVERVESTAETVRAVETVLREAVRPVTEPVERIAAPVGEVVRDTTGALPANPVGDVGPGAGEDARPVDPTTPDDVARPAADGRATPDVTASDRRAAGSTDAANAPVSPSNWDVPVPSADVADDAPRPVARVADGRSRDGESPVPSRLPRAPYGTVSSSAGDGGAPRGGDAPAALPPSGVARFGLVPGAVSGDSSAPTRERYHEILEFPG